MEIQLYTFRYNYNIKQFHLYIFFFLQILKTINTTDF